MQQLHYCLGLPRTGSTLIMNILNENPRIFTTGTCPLPAFVEACKYKSSEILEFISLDKGVLNKSYINFLRQGMKGWFEEMTDKPIVISKSRLWAEHLPHTFLFDPNSKYIVILRDLRDIICSLETLLWKYPQALYEKDVQEGGVSYPLNPTHMKSFEERIRIYYTGCESNLGRPLVTLPHVMEVAQKNPDNFFILRHEDFNEKPKEAIKVLYEFLGEQDFDHDFDNIPKPEYYEHDTSYRALVSHKTESKLKKLEPRWPKVMTKEQSNLIIEGNRWYYETFYSEVL